MSGGRNNRAFKIYKTSSCIQLSTGSDHFEMTINVGLVEYLS